MVLGFLPNQRSFFSFFSFFSFHKFIARFFEILVFGVNFAAERARRHQLSEINFAISVEKCSRAPARSPASDDQHIQIWALSPGALTWLARTLTTTRVRPAIGLLGLDFGAPFLRLGRPVQAARGRADLRQRSG